MSTGKEFRINIGDAIIEIIEIKNHFPWPKYLSSAVYIINDNGKRERLWFYPKNGLKYQYLEIKEHKVLVGFKYQNVFKEIILLEELVSKNSGAKNETRPILIEGKSPTEYHFDEIYEEVKRSLVEEFEEKKLILEKRKETEKLKAQEERKKKEKNEEAERELKVREKRQQKKDKRADIYSREPVNFWNKNTKQFFFGIPVTDDEWPKLQHGEYAIIMKNGKPCEAFVVQASPGGQKKKKYFFFPVIFNLVRKDEFRAPEKPINLNAIWLKNGDSESHRYVFLEKSQAENIDILNALPKNLLVAVNDSDNKGEFPLHLWNGEELELKGYYPKGSKRE